MVLDAETETLPAGGKDRIPQGIAEIAEIIAAVVIVDLHSEDPGIEIQHFAEKINRQMRPRRMVDHEPAAIGNDCRIKQFAEPFPPRDRSAEPDLPVSFHPEFAADVERTASERASRGCDMQPDPRIGKPVVFGIRRFRQIFRPFRKQQLSFPERQLRFFFRSEFVLPVCYCRIDVQRILPPFFPADISGLADFEKVFPQRRQRIPWSRGVIIGKRDEFQPLIEILFQDFRRSAVHMGAAGDPATFFPVDPRIRIAVPFSRHARKSPLS